MHPLDCPEWEYRDIPGHEQILMASTKVLVKAMRSKSYDFLPSSSDARPVHADLFRDLVPPESAYLAGNYRGAKFKCMEHRPVFVGGNAGCPPHLVHDQMNMFAREIQAIIAGLDGAFKVPNSLLSLKEKLRNAVIGACRIFMIFLKIHPFANGNGHIARFCLIAILGRYGYWLKKFDIDPKPDEPGYTAAVAAYRQNDTSPLEELILKSLPS